MVHDLQRRAQYRTLDTECTAHSTNNTSILNTQYMQHMQNIAHMPHILHSTQHQHIAHSTQHITQQTTLNTLHAHTQHTCTTQRHDTYTLRTMHKVDNTAHARQHIQHMACAAHAHDGQHTRHPAHPRTRDPSRTHPPEDPRPLEDAPAGGPTPSTFSLSQDPGLS